MRLSTANQFDAGIASLQTRQQKMQEAQQRLTTGKRIQTTSDDPTAAARAERALSAIGRIEANQRALEASRNSLTLTEGALADASEIMQQIRETLIASGNASYSDPERAGLANKIEGLRNQLLSIANRPDGGGGFLFSGQGASNPPFVDDPVLRDDSGNRIGGGVRYTGVAGSIATGNIETFALTVDGRLAWEQGRTGNGSFVTGPLPNAYTSLPNKPVPPNGWIDAGRVIDPSKLQGASYRILVNGSSPNQSYTVYNTTENKVVSTDKFTPGKSIEFDGMSFVISGSAVNGDQFDVKPSEPTLRAFDVLDQAIEDLRKTNRSGVEVTQSNMRALRDLDSAMGNLQNIRSQVGEQLNNLDGSETRMAALKQYNQAEQSAAEDLDMIQGISDFQNQQSGYDAALKAYATVQRMSLFQYINN